MDQMVNERALKFRERAEKRVTTAIRAIRYIGILSRRKTYDFTDAQIDKIFSAIRSELDLAEAKFTPKEKQRTLFSLD